MSILNAFAKANQVRFIGSLAYEHIVEPFVTSYIDGIDVEEKMKKDYNKSDYTEDELAEYEAAGKDMAAFAENLSKHGVDSGDENGIKNALFRMAGRIGDCAKDDPAMAGRYVVNFKFGSNQLLGAAQFVNSKIAECEENGEDITSDQIMKWGKEGLGMAALKTVSDAGNKLTEKENEAENQDGESYDREAETNALVSGVGGYDAWQDTSYDVEKA